MTRQINEAGLALVRRDEGLKLTAYRDGAGVLTIGYGHTGPSVTLGETITEAQAIVLLEADLGQAQYAVDDRTHDVATTDMQFSAMVSLCFNIGIGAFRTSSVLRFHRLGRTKIAADSFLLWDKAHVNGKLVVLPGLLRRREEERALYLTP